MSTPQPPSPQFVKSIAAGVAYWKQRTGNLSDQAIVSLDAERQNLYRIVEFGLTLSETWRETAVVTLQTFDFVERYAYWQEWIPFLEQAIARCARQDRQLKIKLLNRLGQLYRFLRKLPAAINTHQKAAVIAQALNDKRMSAEVHFNLGADYLDKRDYAKAEQYGQLALAGLAEFPQAQSLRASTLKDLGMVANAVGDLELALTRLHQSVILRRSLNQPLFLARALNDLAITLFSAQAYDEARNYLTEAMALLIPTAHELDKAKAQNNLGMIYYAQAKWPQAEQAFRQANSIYERQPGNIYHLAVGANNLGNIMLQRQNLAMAETYLRRSIELWQKIDDAPMRANTLGTLGEVMAAQGSTTEARQLYEGAITILNAYPDDVWASNIAQKLKKKQRNIKDNDGQLKN